MTRQMERRVTLEDVARAAGVSRATASRVLAGNGPASTTARDRVAAAVTELGYAPNAAAKALVTGAGYRLVVAAAGPSAAVLDDPYVDRFVRAAAEVCAPRGVGVALQWLPLDRPADLHRLAEDRSIHGVLLLNSTEALLAAVPAGLSGRIASIGVGSRAVPAFDVDNAGGTLAVLRHLHASGRRRIAMVTGHSWMPCAQRPVAAYRALMRGAGLPARLVPGDFTAAGGRAAVPEVLRRWPDTDAIFALNDAMALGVLGELRRRGVDVPGDVAVAGFDDIPFAALSAPTLTTASHPVGRIAAGAAAALLDRVSTPPTTSYASELVLRESA
ncbi:LacI family DNA-binding transcriptional regulator [Solwaraspora sp. WMMD1047]|uniref:LacI family DNA-binding transcriptional regulator n=1 Tax=Solwaraspora sp. WMMD1047 TaxID=3016102 RepID=UPI0024166C7F|nr:LacI family DNA-binding transcriptional regulator [Solwaraspora sp. WMMD1047]MDG4831494.1 LacI family DNA-binding transcriptional regulator [Solwaraspora sp. WMMD1047]